MNGRNTSANFKVTQIQTNSYRTHTVALQFVVLSLISVSSCVVFVLRRAPLSPWRRSRSLGQKWRVTWPWPLPRYAVIAFMRGQLVLLILTGDLLEVQKSTKEMYKSQNNTVYLLYIWWHIYKTLYLYRSRPRSHDVSGSVGSGRDHRLPGCREICASAEGRPRTFPRPLTWYAGRNSSAVQKYFLTEQKYNIKY